MNARETPRLEPLRVREGAAYRCFGDGLCCTDVHGLGPLTRAEVRAVRRLDVLGAGYAPDFEDHMLRVEADGGCRFLLPNRYCDIHASHGPEHKPHGCQKFPYGLTATPSGGRIYTEHRCPCRTLGARPQLTVEAAVESLRERDGSLDSDADVERVKLDARRFVPFRRWEAMEAPMLAALSAGHSPVDVLGGTPFPKLVGTTWEKTAREFLETRDGSRFGVALGWFADTVFVLREGARPRAPQRPWADAFDRAEARPGEPRAAQAVLNDFVADHLYSVRWAEDPGYAVFAAEMSTRVVIADDIARRLAAEGLRPDRAMAEAVMVVELVGASEYWTDLLPKMRP